MISACSIKAPHFRKNKDTTFLLYFNFLLN
jgi:hypothetical protein